MFYSITLVGGGQLWSGPTRLRYSTRFAEPKATLTYHCTRNLRAMQMLLGHRKIESTVRLHGQRSQDVRSFSSIEKIAPASILIPRTMQTRPVTSVSLTS